MEHKPYYRIAEISDKTGISKSTLFHSVRNGQIEALRLGKAIFVPAREAERLMGEPPRAEGDTGGGRERVPRGEGNGSPATADTVAGALDR